MAVVAPGEFGGPVRGSCCFPEADRAQVEVEELIVVVVPRVSFNADTADIAVRALVVVYVHDGCLWFA